MKTLLLFAEHSLSVVKLDVTGNVFDACLDAVRQNLLRKDNPQAVTRLTKTIRELKLDRCSRRLRSSPDDPAIRQQAVAGLEQLVAAIRKETSH